MKFRRPSRVTSKARANVMAQNVNANGVFRYVQMQHVHILYLHGTFIKGARCQHIKTFQIDKTFVVSHVYWKGRSIVPCECDAHFNGTGVCDYNKGTRLIVSFIVFLF